MRSLPSVALLVAVSGCAHWGSDCANQLQSVRVGRSDFEVQYQPEDLLAAQQIARVLPQAIATVERWGRFSAPVRVVLHPTHQALEAATCQHSFPWLRAWATYSRIDLQSPRTWSLARASDAEMAQMLTHELTHCLLYQSAATEATWKELDVPLWFLEGMACVTAQQRRPQARLDLIWHFYQEQTAGQDARANGDPLTRPESLYRSRSDLVYGTAQEAFAFLLDRFGEDRVRELIAQMSQGSRFPEAFQTAVGIPLPGFTDDFKGYAIRRGWDRSTTEDGAPEMIGAGAGY